MWRLEDNKEMAHLLQSSTPVPLEDAEIVPIPEKQPSREEWEDTYVFLRKISDDRFLAVKLTDRRRRSKQMIEWISIKDRLPKYKHPVFVMVKGNMRIAYLYPIYDKQGITLKECYWIDWEDSGASGIYSLNEVSTWSEVPKVPENSDEQYKDTENSVNGKWVYKNSWDEYEGLPHLQGNTFTDGNGNEIIYIPLSKR